MVVASGGNTFAKEMAIRKRIVNIFNKREEDFPSLREYNNYLEEVEDMTFNLIEGIDVAAIEAKIAKYQEENAEQIINSRARKAEELAAALKASRGQPAQNGPSDMVSGQSSQAVGGIGVQGQYAPAFPGGQPRPTGLQPAPLGGSHDAWQGSAEDEAERMARAARAGGWSIELSKKRALEEAFSSIWI